MKYISQHRPYPYGHAGFCYIRRSHLTHIPRRDARTLVYTRTSIGAAGKSFVSSYLLGRALRVARVKGSSFSISTFPSRSFLFLGPGVWIVCALYPLPSSPEPTPSPYSTATLLSLVPQILGLVCPSAPHGILPPRRPNLRLLLYRGLIDNILTLVEWTVQLWRRSHPLVALFLPPLSPSSSFLFSSLCLSSISFSPFCSLLFCSIDPLASV